MLGKGISEISSLQATVLSHNCHVEKRNIEIESIKITGYYIDLKPLSIDKYKEVLKFSDLIPSRMILKENMLGILINLRVTIFRILMSGTNDMKLCVGAAKSLDFEIEY